MKVKCHQISTAGAVRKHKKRYNPLCWGVVGGTENTQREEGRGEATGETAGRRPAETALAAFKESPPEATPAAVARQMFDAAAAKVFQAAQEKGQMATTLLASI